MLSHMQSGQILEEHIIEQTDADSQAVTVRYLCLENIGQFVNEEIIKNDGQTNGANCER